MIHTVENSQKKKNQIIFNFYLTVQSVLGNWFLAITWFRRRKKKRRNTLSYCVCRERRFVSLPKVVMLLYTFTPETPTTRTSSRCQFYYPKNENRNEKSCFILFYYLTTIVLFHREHLVTMRICGCNMLLFRLLPRGPRAARKTDLQVPPTTPIRLKRRTRKNCYLTPEQISRQHFRRDPGKTTVKRTNERINGRINLRVHS